MEFITWVFMNVRCRHFTIGPMPFSSYPLFIAVALWVSGFISGRCANVTTTIYVGRHFEVRDYDQPVKYVFNGDVRVARVTGPWRAQLVFSAFAFSQAWNLRSPRGDRPKLCWLKSATSSQR
jgi:hypothetical protein